MYPAQLAPASAKSSTGIGAALDEMQGRTPLSIAMQTDRVTWTFTDVKNHSDALARGLLELGMKKGGSVKNSMDGEAGVVVAIAAAKLGLTVAADKAVPAGAVSTPAGTFAIADISTYNAAPVGEAGAAAQQ